MPKTTKPQNAPQCVLTSSSSEALGNTWNTDSDSLLGLLKTILHGLTKNGKEIYKGLQQCGLWDTFSGSPVTFTGYKNGRIRVSGVKRCDCPDCPVCQVGIASSKSIRLSQAFQELKAQGGDVMFITATTRPLRDVGNAIDMILDFNSLAMKTVNNYTRRYSADDKAIGYANIEGTYSQKQCSKNSDGSTVSPFYYVHTHSHILIGIPPKVVEELGTKELAHRLKSLWGRVVRKHGAYSKLTDDTGFKVEYVDNADKLTSYVNKVFNVESLTAEMTLAHSKTGKGYNLGQVLSLMSTDSKMYGRYYSLIRGWFLGLYGRKRKREYGIDRYVELFKARQRRYIEDYVRKRTTGIDAYEEAIHAHIQVASGNADVSLSWLYHLGWRTYFKEDALTSDVLDADVLNASTVQFVETVDTPVYEGFRKMGLEATLECLFSEYHYHGRCVEAYRLYQELNLGWSSQLFQRLISECKTSSILRGSRARFYH